MARSYVARSYLTCPHNNIQQFTEYCLDCGYNIYTSKKEYLAELQKQYEARENARQKEDDALTKQIMELETKLGIER